jgi:glycosyltransferase involved in cell wall biosynthesis
LDRLNAARRHTEQRLDQAWALAAARRQRRGRIPAFDGEPRFALVTVNASTTRYLKLMLLTLSEQEHLDDLLREITVVDNGSRDGGRPFLRTLAQRVERVRLVELHTFKNHARGMRAGVRSLTTDANVVLFCDPDVVWRNPETLLDLAAVIAVHDGAIAGEPRGTGANPDIQASFLAARRDVLARHDVRPPVNHGSPLLWLQEDVVRAGLTVVQFPSNHGGYILHRGRTAVAATREFTPRRSYATAATRYPHYMGVHDGPAIWAEIEERHAALLDPSAEAELLDVLADRLGTVRT